MWRRERHVQMPNDKRAPTILSLAPSCYRDSRQVRELGIRLLLPRGDARIKCSQLPATLRVRTQPPPSFVGDRLSTEVLA
jgi:hypothetical protein